MPERPQAKPLARPGSKPGTASAYAELHCLSNFSFLRGASHPEELVQRAAELGYAGLAITDRNSLAGVVRAHLAAKKHNLHLIIGAEITPMDGPAIVLLAPDRPAYGRLARLITRGRLRSPKGECELYLADLAELAGGLLAVALPEAGPGTPGTDRPPASAHQPRSRLSWEAYAHSRFRDRDQNRERKRAVKQPVADAPGSDWRRSTAHSDSGLGLARYKEIFGRDLYLAAELASDVPDNRRLEKLAALSKRTGIPLVAAKAVHYHVPQRRYLQDVLTCIREKCTIHTAGSRLFANAQRYLRPLDELQRRYAEYPEVLARTLEIARRCTFTLDELRYEYPHELVPSGTTPHAYLAELTWAGARQRYPDGIPDRVGAQVEKELGLIAALKYEQYFLTVWDLVRFARGRGILCQGRGSAANSAVCYCLGVTAVDPRRIDLLFERFVSRERNEPPDIDIDFEHERREEVFQYIYEKYGRERAAITAEVITYRPRSAVRDVGKALGLSLDRVDVLAKALDWWSEEAVPEEALRSAGLDPRDRTIRMVVRLVRQLLGFPRHLSQHVGGFVITETPLCEIVPLQNGAMPGRTFIEWDKDDIDALGILKVDCLALGMLTAVSKCFAMLNGHEDPETHKLGVNTSGDQHASPLSLHTIPCEDPAVYDMICAADTVGVFQIESRAQMSMLPRLKPRCFYDLVIEVVIVRPGPIQGGMVHPYLRRRNGLEPETYPSPAIQAVLQKTLGVPLFQEQVMRLAVVAAGFSPGEADQLRRSMAAWRRGGEMERFQTRLVRGMLANGYPPAFIEQIYKQIRGFGEYGFPESHAASFALLVYVSAWLKRYHPAAFMAAVLNSQPMGFYAPAQLVRDAIRHGVTVLPVDVNSSCYDCTLEARHGTAGDTAPATWGSHGPALRLGFRRVRGLSPEKVRGVEAARREGSITSIHALAGRPDVSRETLLRLAAADAFGSLGLARRQALWQILALDDADLPLLAGLELEEPAAALPAMLPAETVVQDYDSLGLSLNGHPIGLLRTELDKLRVSPSEKLKTAPDRSPIVVAGLVTHRQRPGTAKGIVFMTLEDETGQANLIIRPTVWDRYRAVGRSKIALIAEGVVERQGAVVHVQVKRLHDLTAKTGSLPAKSRDFR